MVSTRSKTRPNIPVLDEYTAIDIYYFAEGAANVVFRITSPRGTPLRDDDFGEPGTTTEDGMPKLDARLKGKLLRLRKDLPSVAPVSESHRHFEEQIEPLFPAGSLIEQVLCKVTPQFIEKCNQVLRDNEEEFGRPKKRWGVYLARDEQHATSITDMTCDDERASTEFKPKWLAQSPSAPPGSKRCRTCALQAMRNVKINKTPDVAPRTFCPLTLVAGDRDVLSPSLEPIVARSRGAPLCTIDLERKALPYLHKLPLLRLLRDLQVQKDRKGILKTDPSNLDFMTAMTLRDCTFFLKVGAPSDLN